MQYHSLMLIIKILVRRIIGKEFTHSIQALKKKKNDFLYILKKTASVSVEIHSKCHKSVQSTHVLLSFTMRAC